MAGIAIFGWLALVVLVILVLRIAIRWRYECNDDPSVEELDPERLDPYFLAFVRGAWPHVARLISFRLYQVGLLKITQIAVGKRGKERWVPALVRDKKAKSVVEQPEYFLDFFNNPQTAKKIHKDLSNTVAKKMNKFDIEAKVHKYVMPSLMFANFTTTVKGKKYLYRIRKSFEPVYDQRKTLDKNDKNWPFLVAAFGLEAITDTIFDDFIAVYPKGWDEVSEGGCGGCG